MKIHHIIILSILSLFLPFLIVWIGYFSSGGLINAKEVFNSDAFWPSSIFWWMMSAFGIGAVYVNNKPERS